MRTPRRSPKGFTLLEILLVVAAIAILAGIVIVAINPARQLGDTRDAQRRSDVDALASAILQYYIRNSEFPANLPNGQPYDTCEEAEEYTALNICTEGEECSGFSLDTALVDGDFLGAIPRDPLSASSDDPENSGYMAFVNGTRVYVCSLYAENASISAKR